MDERSLSYIGEKRAAINTAMLYLLHIWQILIPFAVTFFLTRALSPDLYGMVVYVQSLSTGIQTIVDFGFNTWSVSKITKAYQANDRGLIGEITGSTIAAKIFLSALCIAGISVLQISAGSDMLRTEYVMLCISTVAISSFLPDFLFCGMEKMHINAAIFLFIKIGAGICKVIFVVSDHSVLLIPLFDLVFTAMGIILFSVFTFKERIRVSVKRSFVWKGLKESVWYFMADFFPTLNSILSVIVITYALGSSEAAIWGLAFQTFNGVIGLQQPIRKGFYPLMVRGGGRGSGKRILTVLMLTVLAGCVICWLLAGKAVLILGGEDYIMSGSVFRCLIPAVFVSFPSMFYGWLVLAAMEKKNNLFISSFTGTIAQVLLYSVLLATKSVSYGTCAAVLFISESVVLLTRRVMVTRVSTPR